MDRRRILVIWGVVVFIVVGAILLFIGLREGEDTDYGDQPGGISQIGVVP
ncbi:hypothetical protein [Nocardioides sp. cx-173]|nr:hypothetical protein [Nocardioides sp. cx-173]MCD4527176.1 hypothetical protein [Nocardioides sp. cx-173]UGB40467.1 hypothetical protein LQ940_13885 [Nocardioides sp. cx-173]